MDQKDVWKFVLGAIIASALFVHAFFPRCEWRTVGTDGAVIVVYDRWAGVFQRAVYDDKGAVRAQQPFKPF